MQKYVKELQQNGYTVVPNVLSKSEVEEALSLFKAWQKTIPNHDIIHRKCDPHGYPKSSCVAARLADNVIHIRAAS